MSVEPKRVRAIFLEAVNHEDPASRKGVVDRECGDDSALRRRVELLLLAHDEPESELEHPVVIVPPKRTDVSREALGDPVLTIDTDPVPSGAITSPPPALSPAIDRPGSRIGPYKLLQEIGEGGMGTVFMAEQVEPVRRRVALKIIKRGMDSAQVIARFEAERQALALMDHLNIAKVLDAARRTAAVRTSSWSW